MLTVWAVHKKFFPEPCVVNVNRPRSLRNKSEGARNRIQKPNAFFLIRMSDILKKISNLGLFFQENEEQQVGKLCCCRGSDECNAYIGQYEVGKRLTDLNLSQNLPSSASFINFSPFPITLVLCRVISC